MGKRATFTQAELDRAITVARSHDPMAVVEITMGAIRILPPGALPVASPPDESEVNTCEGKFGRRR